LDGIFQVPVSQDFWHSDNIGIEQTAFKIVDFSEFVIASESLKAIKADHVMCSINVSYPEETVLTTAGLAQGIPKSQCESCGLSDKKDLT
jgi:hypothetical protein